MLTQKVEFYLASEVPYGPFSNLSPHPVKVDGVWYMTAEHAYHAARFSDPRVAAWFASCPTAGLLAHAVHALFTHGAKHERQYQRPDWGVVKLDRMREVALAKFSGDPALSDLLLGTGDAELVEAGFIDDDAGRFWGRVNGIGENWLGRILMETRDRLRRSPYEVIM
jgi:N-glycosidase YbiA